MFKYSNQLTDLNGPTTYNGLTRAEVKLIKIMQFVKLN